jgi:hypothetical protein
MGEKTDEKQFGRPEEGNPKKSGGLSFLFAFYLFHIGNVDIPVFMGDYYFL